MAIDGAKITSDIPAARPKGFSAAEALCGVLALADVLLLPQARAPRASLRRLLDRDRFHCPSSLVKTWRVRAKLLGSGSAHPPVYNRARATASYSSTTRDLIQGFQIWDRHEGLTLFGRWMAAAGAELLADADAIVPVHLYRSRL